VRDVVYYIRDLKAVELHPFVVMEYSHPIDQANILNKQFQSAFSTKDTYSPDEFNTRCKISGQYPSADELDITENGLW
jgi:hypothetical protein